MTILVTGSTGTIGSLVVQRLAGQSAQIRALVRDEASKGKVSAGVKPVQGDMTDVASMRAALKGVDTLFLLNAVVADETTQALGTLDLAREAGIQRIVYFSTFNSALLTTCRILQASTSSNGSSTLRPFPPQCCGQLPSCRTI
jgi:uncharacterized protein YbjT (DUF2867 family)